MPHPHPLYLHGPWIFMGLSFVVSALATTKTMRWIERRRGPLRRRKALALLGCLVTNVTAFWLVGTAIGLALLTIDPADRDDRLPGAHVDAAVIAHMVPTTAGLASDQLVERLDRGGSATRWSPGRAREARLVLAARIDRRHDRAVQRLADNHYRSQAGRFAFAHPTPQACGRGLDALAEAVQGGALKELMPACRNAPGDPIGYAAFKMGDFMSAVGPETESIISRVPRTPAGERGCFAEGPDVPDASQPICRLVHAELHPASRRLELQECEVEPVFARRWKAALLAEQDDPFPEDALFTIDPELLIERPFLAVIDEPIAVYEEIRAKSKGRFTPGQSAWVRIAIGAERSAMGRHEAALKFIDEAYGELAIGGGASEEERAEVARLAFAIAVRSHVGARIQRHLAELGSDDPLRRYGGHAVPAAIDGAALPWSDLVEGLDGADLAAALTADLEVAGGGLFRLARVGEAQREPIREWLVEAFPACASCGFYRQLDRLTVRLDAAYALADAKMVEALMLIVSRFEAVFLNRTLALSLRGADPEPEGLPPRAGNRGPWVAE